MQVLERTPSRLEMTAQLAELFQKLEDDEIAQACYLMQGKLVPKYQSLEFQLSVKMITRVLARLNEAGAGQKPKPTSNTLFAEADYTQREEETTIVYKKLGDLGLVAEELKKDNPGDKSLSISDVFATLKEVALEEGLGSQERKVLGLVKLLDQLNAVSAKFVVRVVIGKLRLGFSTMTILDALSWAKTGSKEENKDLEKAYQKKADIGQLAQLYLAHDNKASRLKSLDKYTVEVGVPVMPALCQRLNSAAEIIDKIGQVIAEPKYDGLRVQIHLDNGEYRTFTRNLDETSHMFPELEQGIKDLKCKSCILDAEAIGYDKKSGKLLAFQDTVTRKRKHGVAEQSQKIPLRFYVFDVLSINGKSLLETPLIDRKKILKDLLTSSNEVFHQTPYIVTSDAKKLKQFHQDQLGDGLEGAVIKRIDSPYQSGRKGWHWVKIKEEEGSTGKLTDTLDCIVMGYYSGRGKRAQFGIGAILVGVLGKNDRILTIAKIGTGLTDEQLIEMKSRCDKLSAAEKPKQYQVHKNHLPDVWVSPQLVVEIAADEITRSPAHTAAVALRFPRLVKFRDDKGVEEATTQLEAKQL